MDGDGGGETPEELETLLEDAFLLRDAHAVARLFEGGSLLVCGEGPQPLRGHAAILQAAALFADRGCGYLANPRCVFQTRDTALLIGDGVINVARRRHDGSWRFAISILTSNARATPDGPTTQGRRDATGCAHRRR